MSEFTGTTSPVNDTRTAPWPEPVSTPWQLPWPTGCIARYWTVAGATVDLTHRFTVVTPPESFATRAACTGCPASKEFSHWQLVRGMTTDREERDSEAADNDAHEWAQAHASVCRALPRPAQ